MASGGNRHEGAFQGNTFNTGGGAFTLVTSGGSANQTVNETSKPKGKPVMEERQRNISEEGLGIELEADWILPDVLPCSPDYRDLIGKENIYPMTKTPCGHVLMINVNNVPGHGERKGSTKDRCAIEKLFKQLNFAAGDYLYDDADGLTAEDIMTKVGGFFSSKMHERCNAAVMALLSHGGTDTQGREFILGTDGKRVHLDELFPKMTGCRYLTGKPKIVLIQACRNKEETLKLKTDQVVTDKVEQNREPKDGEKDTIYVYGSLPGAVAYRDEVNGSIMIQIVYKVLAKYACEHDVLTLLKQIDMDLKNEKFKYVGEKPEFEVDIRYSLTDDKKLYLLPK